MIYAQRAEHDAIQASEHGIEGLQTRDVFVVWSYTNHLGMFPVF